MKISFYFILLISSISFYSFQKSDEWFASESNETNNYSMGIDQKETYIGKKTFTVKSINKIPDSVFGTWMRQLMPVPKQYLGKRVRMTAYFKSSNVKAYSGLWLRVDKDAEEDYVISMDNMSDRPIIGTTKWKKYHLVVNIPSYAVQLSYGGMINGTGQIWFSNPSFEIVDSTVRITAPTN